MKFLIKKGLDLKIKGYPAASTQQVSLPSSACIDPRIFKGIKPKLTVNVGDEVLIGTQLFFDKNNPECKFVSQHSGKIKDIKFGKRRVVENIVIETDGHDKCKEYDFNLDTRNAVNIRKILIETGMWTFLRQRPFSKIPLSSSSPKALFVSTMSTAPNSFDFSNILKDRSKDFVKGIKMLSLMLDVKINICSSIEAQEAFNFGNSNVDLHQFKGPHPSGNVGIHIHKIDPIKDKNDTVWYINPQDVSDIGSFFNNDGRIFNRKNIAVSGEGVENPSHASIYKDSSAKDILSNYNITDGSSVVSGDILSGCIIDLDSSMSRYHDTLSICLNKVERKFMGWLDPGFNALTASRTFLSSIFSNKIFSSNMALNGSRRSIIPFGYWEDVLPLDVLPTFLVKSILANDIEEMEELGIYECDPEDFALCSFVCQSKLEVSSIIESGLLFVEENT